LSDTPDGEHHQSQFENQKNDGEREPNAWAFVIPFLAFMLIGMLYPKFDRVYRDTLDPAVLVDTDNEEIVLEVNQVKTRNYVVLIGLQVVVACGILFYFRRTYFEQFPLSFNWIAIPVGIIGVVLWIGICGLGIERMILEPMGLSKYVEVRASFNPFQQIPDQIYLAIFLALRFSLLAILVPIIEELFLRGWLIRYIENPQWWVVSLSQLSFNSVAVATIYGVLAHPGEAVAALVWFSLVSWLMLRTGNLWDCVVAHAVTNLLLGLYIVNYGAWHLW